MILPSHPLPLRRCACLLAGAVLASTLRGAPPLPTIPAGTFQVTAYGAVADGSTDNTAAIQNALNAAKTAGGGTVEFPAAAQAYECGPVTVYSGTNLQIDSGATLQALPFQTYPNSTTSPSHFITIASGATNVEISGSGTIDGNGSPWWSAYNAKTITNRPRLVQVSRVDTMRITGVTFQNAPTFNLAFSSANNITIDGVTITAPASSPNTDGIDPAGLHYLITGCTISVGDDNIAVKPGSTACGDLVVTNCTFGSGHGMSVGGQTNVGLNGMTVDHCTFNGTTSGLRLKADATQGGPVQNLTYSNLTMTNVQYPIVFYSYYVDVGSPGALSGSSQTTPAKVASWNASPPNPLNTTTIPTWQNITLTNITATGAGGYSTIWGLPLANALIANVTLNNVQISGSGGLEIYNAQNVQFTGNTSFTVPSGVSSVTTYNALAITAQPKNYTTTAGGDATFTVAAAGTSGSAGTAPTYQWTFNGAALTDGTLADGSTIGGSRTATLTVHNVQTAEAGAYAVRVANALDTYNSSVTTLVAGNTPVTATSATAQLTIAAPVASRLANLSVRCAAGTGEQTLIVGFLVSGYGKPVLVRGVGPSLATIGLSAADVLPDPQLTLYDNNGVYASNDNWGSASTSPALANTASSVGAFPLIDNSLDAALLATLSDGGYSAHVTPNGPTGVTLAEIYDGALSSGARLINLSARAPAGSGTNTLIAGFVIKGTGPKKLLIRGVGPTLAILGVTAPLADPQLGVYRQDGTFIVGNDDWGSTATSPAIVAATNRSGTFPLPDNSKDAALVITLDPGLYSARITAPNGATGIALVEVYDLD